MPSASASEGQGEPAQERLLSADEISALLFAFAKIATVRSCGCERERDR